MIQSYLSRIYLIIFFKGHSHTDILRLILNFNNKTLILLVSLSPIIEYSTIDGSNHLKMHSCHVMIYLCSRHGHNTGSE